MKRNRYLNDRRFLRDNFYPRYTLEVRFALIPMLISKRWIWLRTYYSLRKLSAISFGGQTTISYSTVQRALSFFEFKKRLKRDSMIRNVMAEKRETERRLSSYPDWFIKMLAEDE